MTSTRGSEQGRRMNLKLTDEMHARLKIQAVKERMTLQDLVIRYLDEKLGEIEAALSTEYPGPVRER
jgi:predicted HicB family RNase H-like nuclease